MYRSKINILNELKKKYRIIKIINYSIPIILASIWAAYSQNKSILIEKKTYSNIIQKEMQKLNLDIGYELQSMHLLYRRLTRKKNIENEIKKTWETKKHDLEFITFISKISNDYIKKNLQIITYNHPKQNLNAFYNLAILADFLHEIYQRSDHIQTITFFNKEGFTYYPQKDLNNASTKQKHNMLNINNNLLKNNCSESFNHNWHLKLDPESDKILIQKSIFMQGYCEGLLVVEINFADQLQRIKQYSKKIGDGFFKKKLTGIHEVIEKDIEINNKNANEYSKIYEIDLQTSEWSFIYSQFKNSLIIKKNKYLFVINFIKKALLLIIVLIFIHNMIWYFFNKKIFELLEHITSKSETITSPVQSSRTWKACFDEVTHLLLQEKKISIQMLTKQAEALSKQKKSTRIKKIENLKIKERQKPDLIKTTDVEMQSISIPIFFEEIINESQSMIKQLNKNEQINIKPQVDNKNFLQCKIASKRIKETLVKIIRQAIYNQNQGLIKIGYKELSNNKKEASIKFWIKDQKEGINQNTQIKINQQLLGNNKEQLPSKYQFILECQNTLKTIDSKIEFSSQISAGNMFFFTIKAPIVNQYKYIESSCIKDLRSKNIIVYQSTRSQNPIAKILKNLNIDFYNTKNQKNLFESIKNKQQKIIIINNKVLQSVAMQELINDMQDATSIFVLDSLIHENNIQQVSERVKIFTINNSITIYRFLNIINAMIKNKT